MNAQPDLATTADSHAAAATPAPRDLQLAQRANQLYHDLQAGEFDEVHRRRHVVERDFWDRRVVPLLKRSGARQGIDLCTGTGFVPRALLERLGPGLRILCVDVSAGALEATAKSLGSLGPNVEFHAGSAAAVPWPDASADWVSLNAGLHHVPQPQGVLAEVARVLRPGGRFCLGHEPNRRFFASRAVRGAERAIWNACWYLSPARNRRRLARRLGRRVEAYESHEHLGEINRVLAQEGLIDGPLTAAELHRLVDVHTHQHAGGHSGFDPAELIERNFPAWTVEVLTFSDYGGEMLRARRWLRTIYDAKMRILFPGKGQLFSCVIRKPPEAGTRGQGPGIGTRH